ncbi:hypothetical protein FOMPIDRAFT_1025503 [Fomitopsis schrenkii]|uniref:Uncharacterized protein n=1 Tax=Fomitopsis schrenkii TaxID=2126942 RepID=S8DSD5_FOMSC|nr:hypothetical protein FOMPIDRAFT_1025503 [Fomitopsis schrenkii]
MYWEPKYRRPLVVGQLSTPLSPTETCPQNQAAYADGSKLLRQTLSGAAVALPSRIFLHDR